MIAGPVVVFGYDRLWHPRSRAEGLILEHKSIKRARPKPSCSPFSILRFARLFEWLRWLWLGVAMCIHSTSNGIRRSFSFICLNIIKVGHADRSLDTAGLFTDSIFERKLTPLPFPYLGNCGNSPYWSKKNFSSILLCLSCKNKSTDVIFKATRNIPLIHCCIQARLYFQELYPHNYRKAPSSFSLEKKGNVRLRLIQTGAIQNLVIWAFLQSPRELKIDRVDCRWAAFAMHCLQMVLLLWIEQDSNPQPLPSSRLHRLLLTRCPFRTNSTIHQTKERKAWRLFASPKKHSRWF